MGTHPQIPLRGKGVEHPWEFSVGKQGSVYATDASVPKELEGRSPHYYMNFPINFGNIFYT
jgi:hypothetical protein